jgi:hypothetical protein
MVAEGENQFETQTMSAAEARRGAPTTQLVNLLG